MSEDRNYWMVMAMKRYGGSFVAALGEAIIHADSINFGRLEDAFPDYFQDYRELGDSLKIEDEKRSQKK